jgi:hypothetical protein
MSRLATIIVALCISLGLLVGARAAESFTSEVEALRKVLFQKTDSADDPKWRASLATALHRYCDSVLVQVPRNTPEEDRWVDDELRDLRDHPSASAMPDPHDRFNRILNSAENARKSLRGLFSRCSSISDELTETRQVPRPKEALLWVRLSLLFSFVEETMRLAKIVGLVEPKNGCINSYTEIFKVDDIDRNDDRNDLCSFTIIHNAIITNAVIPLLEGS